MRFSCRCTIWASRPTCAEIGTYFWFPKMTGRMMNEGLGKLHFWLTFIGVYAIFMPMHYLGLAANVRRDRNLFLVPQNDGPHDERRPGQIAFLAYLHRRICDFHADALSGPRGQRAPRSEPISGSPK